MQLDVATFEQHQAPAPLRLGEGVPVVRRDAQFLTADAACRERHPHLVVRPGHAAPPHLARPVRAVRDRTGRGAQTHRLRRGQPETSDLLITSRWIWLVPSKICVTFASRMYRSTGKSRV